jgi:hypothetical protein
MKRFFLPKQVLQRILITAGAVIFLFILIFFLSNKSFSQIFFSREHIFVGTFDFSSSSPGSLQNLAETKSVVKSVVKKPAVQNIKITTKTNIIDVTTTSSPDILKEERPPQLYIKEIQAGDKTGAKNEFAKICNYGDTMSSLSGFSLKKKSSTGKEDGLLNKQWSEEFVGSGECVFVANADAIIPIDTIARWAQSYALAEKENTLLLYYQNNLIDEVFWNQIPKGKSIIRESPTSSWRLSS